MTNTFYSTVNSIEELLVSNRVNFILYTHSPYTYIALFYVEIAFRRGIIAKLIPLW